MAAVASAQPTTARTARTSPLSLAANITTRVIMLFDTWSRCCISTKMGSFYSSV